MNQGKVFEINLDFYKEVQNVVPIINNDDFNYIKFNLFSNGVPYTLADTESAVVKISGHTFTTDVLIWGLGSTAMESAGNNIAELQISSVDKRITTFRFAYKVVKTLSGNAVEIDDPALITLIQLNAAVSALEQTISASEAVRVSAESTRETNENSRVVAEQSRVTEFATMTDVVTPHIADKNNPHSVTKLQVGLGNVSDFGIATQAEAEAGTLDNKYMTPLKVKQAVAKSVEVVDARFSSERNVTYSTLKGRLDAIDTDIVKPKTSTPVDATQPIISLPNTTVKGKLDGSLKGNTMYQAVVGGDFANLAGWTGISSTLSVLNKVLSINANGASVYPNVNKIIGKAKNGEKWFIGATVKPLANTTILSLMLNAGVTQALTFASPTIGEYKKVYGVITLSGQTEGSNLKILIQTTLSSLTVDKVMEIDGNTGIFAIPITSTPYESLTSDVIDRAIDGYWEGLGGTQPSRVKATGKNLFNEFQKINSFGSYVTPFSSNGKLTFNNNNTANRSSGLFLVFLKNGSTYKFTKFNEVITVGSGVTGLAITQNLGTLNNEIAVNFNSFTWNGTTGYVQARPYTNDSTSQNVSLNIQLELGTTVLPYEPYTETELYCPVPLCRISTTIFDEFDFNGKLTQRTAEKLNQTGTVNYADMPTGGSFMAQLSDGTLQIGVKGDTLTATATKILYQLATLVETYYPVSELIAEPNGTVYVDSKINVVKSYTTNIAVTSKIKSLESIYKITGDIRTPISISSATVASDGMSLTIIGAIAGEMYDIKYETYGTLLPTINYSYPLNLLAVVEFNTKMIADLAGDLYAFRKMQNLINLQFDARLITGGH